MAADLVRDNDNNNNMAPLKWKDRLRLAELQGGRVTGAGGGGRLSFEVAKRKKTDEAG